MKTVDDACQKKLASTGILTAEIQLNFENKSYKFVPDKSFSTFLEHNFTSEKISYDLCDYVDQEDCDYLFSKLKDITPEEILTYEIILSKNTTSEINMVFSFELKSKNINSNIFSLKARDISNQKKIAARLIENNILLNEILLQTSDLIIISDYSGNIVFANSPAEFLLNNNTFITGLNILDFADKTSKRFLVNHFRSRKNGITVRSDGQLRLIDTKTEVHLVNFNLISISSETENLELFIGQDQTRDQMTSYILQIQRDIGRELTRITTVEEASSYVIEEICKISGIENCALLVYSEETEILKNVYSKSFPGDLKHSLNNLILTDENSELLFNSINVTLTTNDFSEITTSLPSDNNILSICVLPIKNIENFSLSLITTSSSFKKLPDYIYNAIHTIRNMLSEGIARIYSEQARKDAESKFKTFMDNLPAAAFLRDADKNLLYTNTCMREILEIISEEQNIPAGIIPPVLANTFFDFESNILDSNTLINEEYTLSINDKTAIFDALKFPLTTENGDSYFGGIITDITEKKKFEKDLKSSEQRYRNIVSALPDIVLRISKDGIVLDSVIGESFESTAKGINFISNNLSTFGLERKHNYEVLRLINKSINENVNTQYQFECIQEDKNTHFEVRIIPTSQKEAMLYFRDISDRVSIEKDLLDEQIRFRTIFETSPDAIVITKADNSEIIDVNKQMWETVGISYNDLVGKTIDDLSIWVDDDQKRRFREEVKTKGFINNFEAQFKVKENEITNTLIAAKVIKIDNELCMITIVHNIDDYIRARQDLQESEQKFRQLIENQGEGVFIVDKDEIITFANPAAEKIFAVNKGELLGKSIADFTVDSAFSSMRKRTQKRKMGTSETYELIIHRQDKTTATLLVTASSQYDAKGEMIGSFGVFRDISMIKSAEKALRESEKKYRQLFELESDALFVVDSETGRILEANNAAIEMYGYEKEDFARMEIYQLTGDCREYSDALRVDGNNIDKCIQVRKDNTFFPAEITLRHFRRNKRKVHISAVRDITFRMQAEEERMQLETQLRQAQKLEAVGRLAGGIAHDFNNLLTAILGHTQLLQMQISTQDPIYRETEEILNVSKRATRLIQQLLTFSRKQVITPKVVNLNQVISDMERMLQRIIGDDIILATSQSNDLKKIFMDVTQLEQIVVNLAVNARDAMPDGGNLDLETSNLIIDENIKLLNPEISPGEYVCLAISDTGIGMDKRTLEKIFEPFFTTKEEGKGTGLGLSTAYGIVKQNGGHIEVYSEPSIGTTFNIFLPASVDDTDSEDKAKLKTNNPYGSETILVAENDDLVRDLSVRALEQFGYTVIEAENGMEAYQIINRSDKKIDLVLTDVVMPLLSGPELVIKAKDSGKLFKVIYMSGYTDNNMVDQELLQHSDTFLKKPFSPIEMVNKVRNVLNTNDI